MCPISDGKGYSSFLPFIKSLKKASNFILPEVSHTAPIDHTIPNKNADLKRRDKSLKNLA